MLFFGKENKKKEEYVRRLVARIQEFDVIAVSRIRWYNPLSWTSRVTRILTASKYSHVLVAGRKGYGWSTGATGFPFFRFGEIELFDYLMDQDAILVHRVHLSESQKAEGRKAIASEIGKPYPEAELIGMVLQNFVSPGSDRLFLNGDGRVCSAVTSYFFEVMGRKLAPHLGVTADMMTPQRCMEDPEATEIGIWPIPKRK